MVRTLSATCTPHFNPFNKLQSEGMGVCANIYVESYRLRCMLTHCKNVMRKSFMCKSYDNIDLYSSGDYIGKETFLKKKPNCLAVMLAQTRMQTLILRMTLMTRIPMPKSYRQTKKYKNRSTKSTCELQSSLDLFTVLWFKG